MPRYDYECPSCHLSNEVVKSIAQLDDLELCTDCAQPMLRVISAVQISPAAKPYEAHNNHAFGKVITSKRQIEEEKARYKGEKGRELVEVGTDDLKSVKKVRKEYKADGIIH